MSRQPLAALVAGLSLAALLGLAGRPAGAADQRTLAELCGGTVTTSTIVEVQGGANPSFGDCTITVDGARLRLIEAALDGRRLAIRGQGSANLDIVGGRIRAALEISGSFQRILLLSSLIRGADAQIEAASGNVMIRLSTVRDGNTRVRTGDGWIRMRQARFFDRSSFDASFGGIDIRFSDFRDPVEAIALGTGDLAFLSNKVRGPASFIGDERVAIAGNTFEVKPDGRGGLDAEGNIILANNRSEGNVTLRATDSLLVIANTFEAGRPAVSGQPASCIIEDNVPTARCP